MNKNNEQPKTENSTELSLELETSTIKEICHLLSVKNDEDFTFEFFKNLFTPPELKDMASRWLLVKELDKGTTQREIARKFGMSLCKITRGSKELSKEDSAFRKMLSLLQNESKK